MPPTPFFHCTVLGPKRNHGMERVATVPRMIMLQSLVVALASLVLVTEPYKNMSIGMEITLPSDGKVVATSSNPPSCMIQGGSGETSWHMKIDRVLDTQQKSAQELVQLAFHRHQSSEGIKIIDEGSLMIGDIDSRWLRASLPIQDAQDSTLCWLVLPIHGNQALMASILTTDKAWKRSGEIILASLSSIKLLNPATTLTERIIGLDNATSLLSDLSSETLAPSIGNSSWRQIQQFTDGQIRPVDIGYAHISSRIGTKSEIGTSDAVDNEKGLVVEVRSRIIPDEVSSIVIDTVGLYWMSFDGKEELWSSTDDSMERETPNNSN